jgi:hypothetical protein
MSVLLVAGAVLLAGCVPGGLLDPPPTNVGTSGPATSASSASTTKLNVDGKVAGTTKDGVTLTVVVRVSNATIVTSSPESGTGDVSVSIVADVAASFTNTTATDFTPPLNQSLKTYYVYAATGVVCAYPRAADEGTVMWDYPTKPYCVLSGAVAVPNPGTYKVIRSGETQTESKLAATLVRVHVPRDSVASWKQALSSPAFAVASLEVGGFQLFATAENECTATKIVPLSGAGGVCQVLGG